MVAVTNVDAQVETLRQRLAPAVAALDLELYDVELLGGAGKPRTLRVTVTARRRRPRGDHRRHPGRLADPRRRARRSAAPFLLEVSSPGVERALRTPAHYARRDRRDGFGQGPHRRRARAACTARSSTSDDATLRRRGRRGEREEIRVRRRHPGAHRVRVGSATAPPGRRQAREGQGRARAKG